MSLIALILTLVAVGVILWAVNKYGAEFIDAKILKIINVVAIIAVVLWLLRVFGIWDYASSIRV